LPIWVDIMNAAAKSYPPKEIKQPASLKKIEICSRSGLLATDKCYDADHHRTTYMEIATASQAPTEPCNVHQPRARLAREFSSSDMPRAALAVDLSEVTPISIKSPTLVADQDPYDSLKATLKPEPAPAPQTPPVSAPENQSTATVKADPEVNPASSAIELNPSSAATPEASSEIRKAIPVQTIRKAIPVSPQEKRPVEIRRAVPVNPVGQANEDRTLLRSAARPPDEPDN
jgi:hypothetical protein